MSEEKNKLFYTKLYEKCSPKDRETGEFEECCQDGVTERLSNIARDINDGKNNINRYNEPPLNSMKKAMDVILNEDDE